MNEVTLDEPAAARPAGPFSRDLRCWYAAPWGAILGCLILAGFLPSRALDAITSSALLASVVLFGLPHGSADWWVLQAAAGTRWRGGTLWLLLLGYVAAALLTLAAWRWQPAIALAGFLALTVWHFGSADASVLLPGSAPLRSTAWWLFAWGRGLLVIAAPLAFHPVEAGRLLYPFAALDGSADQVTSRLLALAPALAVLGFGWCLAGASCRCIGPRQERPPHLVYNALETLGLAALFWLTPPLLGFTCYFVAFHAWRHILRLGPLLPSPGTPQSLGRAVADYHRRTLPVTLASLLGLGLIFSLWPKLFDGRDGRITAYFIFLSALTVPHALVIGWLDATQGAPRP